MNRTSVLTLMIALVVTVLPVPVNSQVSTSVFIDPIRFGIHLNANGSSLVEVDFRINNNGSELLGSFEFRLDSLDFTVLNVQSEGESLDYTIVTKSRYSLISLDFPSAISPNESRWVHLELLSFDLQSMLIEYNTLFSEFTLYIRPLTPYYNLTLAITLPQDAMLSRRIIVPLFPDPDSNFTDGQSLTFLWNELTLMPGQERVYIAKYQIQLPSDGQPTSALWTFVIAVIFFIGGVLITRFGPLVITRLRNIGRVRVVGLTHEEQQILEIVRRKGGSCPQKDLYREFNLSQSKVSMMITTLEERGLVRRLRDGRENIIYIVEE